MANDLFYYYEGKKIPLMPSATKRAVKFDNPVAENTRELVATVMGGSTSEPAGVEVGNGIILYDVANNNGGISVSSSLRDTYSANELPVFETSGDDLMVVTEEFIARFKSTVKPEQVKAFNQTNGVKVVRENDYEPNAFILAVEGAGKALEMANRYQESGLVDYAQPN